MTIKNPGPSESKKRRGENQKKAAECREKAATALDNGKLDLAEHWRKLAESYERSTIRTH